MLIDAGIRVLAGLCEWHFMQTKSEMNSSHTGDVVSSLGRQKGSREVADVAARVGWHRLSAYVLGLAPAPVSHKGPWDARTPLKQTLTLTATMKIRGEPIKYPEPS